MTKRLPPRYRTCARCGTSYQIKDARSRYCSRRCLHRDWVAARPGYMVEAQRRYLARHPERREQQIAYMQAYRARPEVKARQEELRRQRYVRNPGPVKAYVRARAARYRVGHTEAEWEALKELYDQRCAYCEKRRRLTKDHVIPISEGDPETVDRIENIVPACRPCNSKKHTKPWRPRPVQGSLL